MEKPLHVFCCYAHSDESYLRELTKRLIPLQREGLIILHTDIGISPGEEWEQKIHHYLNTAHIILLLVSADFIASDYGYSKELPRALERHREGKARVIPIILRPVNLQRMPFGQIQSLPTDAKPIAMWINQDEAYLDVVNGIEAAIENLLSPSQANLLLAQQASTLQKPVEHQFDSRITPTAFRTLAGTAEASAWYSHKAYVAIGHNDGQIQIWEVSSGQLVCTCWGHANRIQDITWSPNGTRLASLSRDKTIRIWDARKGQVLAFASKPLDKTGRDYLRWSPDGTRLAALSGNKNIMYIYNATTGQLITSYQACDSGETCWAMEWSLDSTRLALSLGGESIQFMDASTGQTISACTNFSPYENGSIAWSPDGTHFLFGGDKRVYLLNVQTQETTSPYQGDFIVQTVAYSSKGTYFTYTSGENVKLYNAATQQLITTFRKNQGTITEVKWSPDETYIASSSHYGRVQVVELATGQISTSYDNHIAKVTAVRWSPDGALLATSADDTTIQVWDVQTGKRLSLYSGHEQRSSAFAWSPDGTRIASSDYLKMEIHIWSVATGERISKCVSPSPVYALAWSPDGTCIAFAGLDKMCHIWDTSAGYSVSTLIEKLNDVAYTVIWSPDGNCIATCGSDSFVAWSPKEPYIASGNGTDIWDAQTGEHVFTYTRRYYDSEQVDVWDVNTRETLSTYKGHSKRVGTVAWSPDGNRIASGSQDRTVQVWHATTGKPIATYNGYDDDNPRAGVAWSPNGEHIAFSVGATMVQTVGLNIPQPARMQPRGTTLVTYREHTSRVTLVTWSPDGSRIASTETGFTPDKVHVPATVQVWDATSGRRFLTHQAPDTVPSALAWSPDGTRLASANQTRGEGRINSQIQIWDATTGHVLFTYQGAAPLAWSPDGTRLVSIYQDTIQIWYMASGRNLLTWTIGPAVIIGQHEIHSIAWSPDGTRIISGGEDLPPIGYYAAARDLPGGVQVWDATTGNRLLVCQGPRVRAIAWSPDGTRLASGGEEGTVQVWDATRGEELLTYREHGEGWIRAVAWSPNGMWIASGGSDKTVQVWDAVSGRRLLTYQGHLQGVYISSIAWSPDSTRIASAGADMTAQIWQAT